MKKKSIFIVIGTNSTTKNLKDKTLETDCFVFSSQNRCFIDFFENDQKYIFECKQIKLIEKNLILDGFMSDQHSNVGRISLKYLS